MMLRSRGIALSEGASRAYSYTSQYCSQVFPISDDLTTTHTDKDNLPEEPRLSQFDMTRVCVNLNILSCVIVIYSSPQHRKRRAALTRDTSISQISVY